MGLYGRYMHNNHFTFSFIITSTALPFMHCMTYFLLKVRQSRWEYAYSSIKDLFKKYLIK